MKLRIRTYQESDKKELIQLWKDCGLVVPWNNPELDIERKLNQNSDEILVGLIDDKIVATAIVGYDGHRGWIYYLGVNPKYQKLGFGNQLMREAEKYLLSIGCPKINIMVRESNTEVINFYGSIGYKKDTVITMSKRLIPDD
jgi:ribosomal protein S18 acetylase RimI-like enzyme